MYTKNKSFGVLILDTIKIKAYAKVNLSLDVIARKENGYHEVEMIMQQVTLYDNVTITKKDKGISINCDSMFVPNNHKNIAYKIAEDVLNIYNIESGIHIDIKKKIPVAAGLAGGSANAAAVIKGLNKLFALDMTLEEMKDISLKHGADIPFCIEGGAAVARGIGEELQVIKGLDKVWMVLYKPSIGISTREIYSALDINKIYKHPNTNYLLENLESGNFKEVARNMYNVLEEVTVKKYSLIKEIEGKMKEYGAIGAMMSGSGPTVFGIFKNYRSAECAYKNLLKKNKQVFLVMSYDGGKNYDE